MNTRQLAWWRMVFNMVALLRQWQLERSRDPYWHPTGTERVLFESVSDFWAEVMMQSRPVNSRVLHDRRRACPQRDGVGHVA